MLGELCAIQGQVEYLLAETLRCLLGVSVSTARVLLGSNSVRVNSEIWISLFREKCTHPEILKEAEAAYALIKTISEGRNDFIHAIFAWGGGKGWTITGWTQHRFNSSSPPIALRVRNLKQRPVSELVDVRNNAAELSCILARIDDFFMPQEPDWPDDLPEWEATDEDEPFP